MQKNLSEMNVVELKVVAWDLHSAIERLNQQLNIVAMEITNRERNANGKPDVKPESTVTEAP